MWPTNRVQSDGRVLKLRAVSSRTQRTQRTPGGCVKLSASVSVALPSRRPAGNRRFFLGPPRDAERCVLAAFASTLFVAKYRANLVASDSAKSLTRPAAADDWCVFRYSERSILGFLSYRISWDFLERGPETQLAGRVAGAGLSAQRKESQSVS